MLKTIVLLAIAAVLVFAVACGSGTGGGSQPNTKTIKSAPAGNNLTVALGSADGVLKKGKQDLTLTFTDSSGKPVDVGSASVNFFMPSMGSMSAMNNPATLTTTGTPGVYNAQVSIDMTGDWQAQVKYEGPAGTGSATIPVSAQ